MEITKSPLPARIERSGSDQLLIYLPLRVELDQREGVWVEAITLEDVTINEPDYRSFQCTQDVSIFVFKDPERPKSTELIQATSVPLPLRPEKGGANTIWLQLEMDGRDYQQLLNRLVTLDLNLTLNRNTEIPLKFQMEIREGSESAKIKSIERKKYPFLFLINAVVLFALVALAFVWNSYASQRVHGFGEYFSEEWFTSALAFLLAFFGLSLAKITGFFSDIKSFRFFSLYPEMNVSRQTFDAFKSRAFSAILAILAMSMAFFSSMFTPVSLNREDLKKICKDCKFRVDDELITSSHVWRRSVKESRVDVVCDSDSLRIPNVQGRKPVGRVRLTSWLQSEFYLLEIAPSVITETNEIFSVEPGDITQISKFAEDDVVAKHLEAELGSVLVEQIREEFCRTSRANDPRLRVSHDNEYEKGHSFEVEPTKTVDADAAAGTFVEIFNKYNTRIENIAKEKSRDLRFCQVDGLAHLILNEIQGDFAGRRLTGEGFVHAFKRQAKDVDRMGNVKFHMLKLDILSRAFRYSDPYGKMILPDRAFKELADMLSQSKWGLNLSNTEIEVVQHVWELFIGLEARFGFDTEGRIHNAIAESIKLSATAGAKVEKTRGFLLAYLKEAVLQEPKNLDIKRKRGLFFSEMHDYLVPGDPGIVDLAIEFPDQYVYYSEFFPPGQVAETVDAVGTAPAE